SVERKDCRREEQAPQAQSPVGRKSFGMRRMATRAKSLPHAGAYRPTRLQGSPDQRKESPLPQSAGVMENRNYTVESRRASKNAPVSALNQARRKSSTSTKTE